MKRRRAVSGERRREPEESGMERLCAGCVMSRAQACCRWRTHENTLYCVCWPAAHFWIWMAASSMSVYKCQRAVANRNRGRGCSWFDNESHLAEQRHILRCKLQHESFLSRSFSCFHQLPTPLSILPAWNLISPMAKHRRLNFSITQIKTCTFFSSRLLLARYSFCRAFPGLEPLVSKAWEVSHVEVCHQNTTHLSSAYCQRCTDDVGRRENKEMLWTGRLVTQKEGVLSLWLSVFSGNGIS